jgi:hypothetical protein
MPERGTDEWLEELRAHLNEVAGKLLEATRQAEHAGALRTQIDRQLAAIEDMLEAIERHLKTPASRGTRPS